MMAPYMLEVPCCGFWMSSFVDVLSWSWSWWSISLSAGSSVGHTSVLGLVTLVGGLMVGIAEAAPFPMAISEQARNSSWSPQPTAPFPSAQSPQLFPAIYFHCNTQCSHSSSVKRKTVKRLQRCAKFKSYFLAIQLWFRKFLIRFVGRNGLPSLMVLKLTEFHWQSSECSCPGKLDVRWCHRRVWTRSIPCDLLWVQHESWHAIRDCIYAQSHLGHIFHRTHVVEELASPKRLHTLRIYHHWFDVDAWIRHKTVHDRCNLQAC